MVMMYRGIFGIEAFGTRDMFGIKFICSVRSSCQSSTVPKVGFAVNVTTKNGDLEMLECSDVDDHSKFEIKDDLFRH